MIVEKWTIVGVVLVVGALLISTCGPRGDAVPSEVSIDEVEVTSPPEIDEGTGEEPNVPAEPGEEAPDLDAGCTYNGYCADWVMDYGDPENVLNVLFHPGSPFQYTFWDDQTYRDLVEQALSERDSDARMELWQQAERILVTEHAAVIPIYHSELTVLVRPEIEAVFTPFGGPPIKDWRLLPGQTTLRYATWEPETLDVSQANDLGSFRILGQVMEGLYEYDEEGRIQPAGAVSYQISEDGLVYTVKLREDATWSDGVPVTAQHYVDGIIRLLDPGTEAWYAWLMYVVQGAESYNTGETADPASVGVRAVDAHTLEIRLVKAASHFGAVLAFSTTYPVRLDVIEEHGDLWTRPQNLVCNGAYLLAEWDAKWPGFGHIVLEKNPDYWGADDVTIERIEFRFDEESYTALAAYERGELDVSGYPHGELPRILEEMPEHLRRVPFPGTWYIGLNTLRPPTDNPNLRKALSSAVDRWAILDDVLETPWRIAACGVVPPEIAGYQGCGAVGYEFDLEAAQGYLRAALEEMGVDDPADVSITLWSFYVEDIAGAIAEQWETTLGIQVDVSRMNFEYWEILSSCGG
jgi:oligopeptide transport system substrate-binding protein